eukprot:scaffold74763_cov69-Phaeocystis_antarctica.AAC.1
MVEHKGVVSLLHGAQSRPYPPVPNRLGVSSNYVFDIFVFHLFCGLGVLGGSCILLQDSLALLELEDTDNLTYLYDVPSVLAVAHLPPSVSYIETGAEALSIAAVKNVGGATLFNWYGPTECTVGATGGVVKTNKLPARLTSIGKPLQNVTSYVVDP